MILTLKARTFSTATGSLCRTASADCSATAYTFASVSLAIFALLSANFLLCS